MKGLSIWKLGYNPENWVLINYAAPAETWYYSGTALSDAKLSDLRYNNERINSFQTDIYEYTVELPFGTIQPPTVTAYKNHSQAGEPVITQTSTLPGTATVTVTSADGLTQQSYKIDFTVAPAATADECFIATACFGSKYKPAVVLLRQFRDHYLLTNEIGKRFVAFYYRISPPLANRIAASDELKLATRIALTPLILLAFLAMHPISFMVFLTIIFAFYKLRKNKLPA
jgi:hypothetical protein